MLRRVIEYGIVAIALTAVYFWFFNQLNLPVSDEFMFSTPDSKSYKEVADWMRQENHTHATNNRPLFYPFILLIGTSLAGAKGVWILHFMMWLFAGIFLYDAVKNYSSSRMMAVIATVVFAMNISLIGVSLHGVTEITSVFLLCWLLWVFSRNGANYFKIEFLWKALFILALLSITKPLFYPVFLAGLAFTVLLLFRAKDKILSLALLLIAGSPVAAQLIHMKLRHNAYTLSTISDVTFKQYLLTDAYAHAKGIRRLDAWQQVAHLPDYEIEKFKSEHRDDLVYAFRVNIVKNMIAASPFLTNPVMKENKEWSHYMLVFNMVGYRVHHFIIWPMLAFLLLRFRKKWNHWMVPVLFSTTLSWYVLISSGISGQQGDRLILSALPLWLFAYASLVGLQLPFVKETFLKLIVPKFKRR